MLRLNEASTILPSHRPGKSPDARALNIADTGLSAPDEPDMDWDPDTAMDQEAAVQAEIERRRRAREAAFKRGIGAATPTIQALQVGDRPASTPASTRQSTPGPLRADGTTPLSSKNPLAISFGHSLLTI